MSSKCFVPICKNTVGRPFPEDQEEIQKWLDGLKIKNVVPNHSSFVCLDHFNDTDILQDTNSVENVSQRLKDGAVPSVSPNRSCSTKQKNALTESDHPDDGNAQVENETLLITNDDDAVDDYIEYTINETSNSEQNVGALNNKQDNCETELDKGSMNSQAQAAAINNESVTEVPTLESSDITSEVTMHNIEAKICRLCGKEAATFKNIFKENLEQNVPLVVAIMACLYPIEISKHDDLSEEICISCLECLKGYFKFRSICLEHDRKHKIIHSKNAPQMVQGSSKQKRRTEDISSDYGRKKQRTESENSSYYTDEYDDDDDDDLDSLSNFLIKKEAAEHLTIEHHPVKILSPPPLIPLQRQLAKPAARQSQSEIDKKFDRVEEELRRVLEGQLTEEQAQAENIIIHVQNDEEERCHKLATLSKLKLPIVIKPLESKKSIKKESAIPYTRRKIIAGDIKVNHMKIKTEFNQVTLPKGINVTMKEVYKSELGTFTGTALKYVFDMEFCDIAGYLFEYRLCKGNTRYLRCVLPACHGLATQTRISPGTYSNMMSVQRPHNHKKPDQAEKKKQMFYYVMKRKMQSDKTLNFRSVYEEVCKQDAEIKDLVPLRNVINEICRHQLTYKIPVINNFSQFYDAIEQDAFQKLHFTHNNRQFYQEKFTAEDDSKAIVFANNDIIEQVSYSNLMYVDASFKIDTKENFKYQLVTVLVWIDDSYYPILYALVNQRTQEIYKKIFEYLHDVLAPKLRPEEIVTDYEAPLYYALGETYLDSSIGGSVFYYTQNLYKKICSLKLSRDLETNSYFRNIYHMLLMLPLLPVNTILDGLNNMEIQAKDLSVSELATPMFEHVRSEWIQKVTPDLFCVHRLENRINENVIAPFKKLRDFIMLSKGKMQKQNANIVTVVEKLIELEHFLQVTYSTPNKKSFARDLSSSQKKNVLKAWQYIESHPKININNFFSKVLGYIKCMENQLWIWGFYRYDGDVADNLINATNFSIISNNVEGIAPSEEVEQDESEPEYVEAEEQECVNEDGENGQVVMEAVIDEDGGFVLQNNETDVRNSQFENAFLKYVYKE